MLGNDEQLRQFATVLNDFAQSGEPVELGERGIFSEDTKVQLRELQVGEREGLWVRQGGKSPLLEWCLTRDRAEDFADDVMKTANGESLAGSSTLECEVLNEVRVKVSFGEFEEKFLLGNVW